MEYTKLFVHNLAPNDDGERCNELQALQMAVRISNISSLDSSLSLPPERVLLTRTCHYSSHMSMQPCQLLYYDSGHELTSVSAGVNVTLKGAIEGDACSARFQLYSRHLLL